MECENQRCYITGAGRAEGGDDGHAVPAGPVGEPGCDDCQVTCLVGHINIRENMQCAVWQAPLLVLLCLWLLLLFQEAESQSILSVCLPCAVNLSGGDRGEAIAIDDADLEMRSSGLR